MQDNNNHLFINHKFASHLGYVLQCVDSHNGEAEVTLFHVSFILLEAAGYPEVIFCSWEWKNARVVSKYILDIYEKVGKAHRCLTSLVQMWHITFVAIPFCQNQ